LVLTLLGASITSWISCFVTTFCAVGETYIPVEGGSLLIVFTGSIGSTGFVMMGSLFTVSSTTIGVAGADTLGTGALNDLSCSMMASTDELVSAVAVNGITKQELKRIAESVNGVFFNLIGV
jgi:hypothetical protein